MPHKEWEDKRMKNPYDMVRNTTCDPKFWNEAQEKIYDDIYETNVHPVVPQKAVDFTYLRNNEDYFEGVVEACEKLDLYKIMALKNDFCP